MSSCSPGPQNGEDSGQPPFYDEEVVLFVGPDSTALHELKAAMSEEDFYTVADDEMWYRSEAFTLLDSLGIAYETIERRALRFEVNGEAKVYDWQDVQSLWFVVIYDGDSEPKMSHSIDLPFDLGLVAAP